MANASLSIGRLSTVDSLGRAGEWPLVKDIWFTNSYNGGSSFSSIRSENHSLLGWCGASIITFDSSLPYLLDHLS